MLHRLPTRVVLSKICFLGHFVQELLDRVAADVVSYNCFIGGSGSANSGTAELSQARRFIGGSGSANSGTAELRLGQAQPDSSSAKLRHCQAQKHAPNSS